MWGMDIMSPFPLATAQRQFVIVAIDYFTKWAEAEALATITEKKCEVFFWRAIVCRFGILRVLIIDNGRQFDNATFQTFCANLSIEQRFTSVAHPQSNEQTEVINRILLQGIKKKLEGVKGLWAYNTTTRTPTGETPFNLSFGTEALIPVEVGLPSLRLTTYDPVQNEEALRTNLDLLDECREQVVAALKSPQTLTQKHPSCGNRTAQSVRADSFPPFSLFAKSIVRSNFASELMFIDAQIKVRMIFQDITLALVIAMNKCYLRILIALLFDLQKCSQINRFVALSVVLLSFHFISTINPNALNFRANLVVVPIESTDSCMSHNRRIQQSALLLGRPVTMGKFCLPATQEWPSTRCKLDARNIWSSRKKARGPTMCANVWARETQKYVGYNNVGQMYTGAVKEMTAWLGTFARKHNIFPIHKPTFSDFTKDDLEVAWAEITEFPSTLGKESGERQLLKTKGQSAVEDAKAHTRSELEAFGERLQQTITSQVELIFNRLDDLEVDSRLVVLEWKVDVFVMELDDLIEERVTYFTKRKVQQHKELKEQVTELQEELASCKRKLTKATRKGCIAMQPRQKKIAEPKSYDGVREARQMDNLFWHIERYFETTNIEDEEEKVQTAVIYLTSGLHRVATEGTARLGFRHGDCREVGRLQVRSKSGSSKTTNDERSRYKGRRRHHKGEKKHEGSRKRGGSCYYKAHGEPRGKCFYCAALSTIEAEYTALTEAAKEALWLKGLVDDLGFKQRGVLLQCDSQSAKDLANNQVNREESFFE
ncbi:hypothetical protein RJ639_016219 [Escallonia herrerae]|uniref:Integrase catalytic domain-containing protein n=1 Tax=Escallonia herrerae TaxID=1293975 RepID=A0AA89AK66_9ASTE|nr:hypothetical protein RJ639_016219 [Escallonia herrerae]